MKAGGVVSEVRFKTLDSFTLETLKNHLIRKFPRNGRVRVKTLTSTFSGNWVFELLIW